MSDDRLVLRSRGEAISLRLSRRTVVMCVVLLLLVAALSLWALTLGELPLSLVEIWAALSGNGSRADAYIVTGVRIPRALTAALVGFGLAVAGASFQRTVRNPLASPDILGISLGASVGAVMVIVLNLPMLTLGPLAATGAVLTAALVLALGHRGAESGARIILVGIGISAALSGIVAFATVFAHANLDAERIYRYTTGSLGKTSWDDFAIALAGIVVLVPPLLILDRQIGVMEMGREFAAGLGLDGDRASLLILGLASVLVGLLIAASGPIGFVALVAPHAARAVLGRLDGGGMMVAGLVGALMLLGADMVGQHAFAAQLPAGAITAAAGAPYFVLILLRGARRGEF